MWTPISNNGSATDSGIQRNKYIPIAYKTATYNNDLSVVSSTRESVTYKVRHSANLKCGLIRLVYGNWYGSGTSNDVDGVNDITIGASLEYSGVLYPVTFNGQKKITINPGGTVFSDPIGVFFSKDDTFYTRNYVSVATGQRYPIGLQMENGVNEGIGQGDLTASGTFSYVNESMYHPIAIVGIPDVSISNPYAAFMFIGDSITSGYAASFFGNGHAQLTGKKWGRGTIVAGVGGSYGHGFASIQSGRYRHPLTQFVTHIILMFGTNDLVNFTAETVQQDMVNIANRYVQMGLKVYICTIPPRTDSANTTPRANYEAGPSSERAKLNAWIRTKPAPYTDFIDLSDVVESSRDSGLWKTGMSGDGVHPSPLGYDTIANAINLNALLT